MILPMENGKPIINSASGSSDATIASFSVIAIHDGYQAEMQVNTAFAWLHQSFRADLQVSFKSWSFEKLVAAPDIRAMSVLIGSEADMIIIATSSAEPLPDHITRWLDSITWQRNGRALMIAIEDDAGASFNHKGTLCECLQQWAARWHVDLICCEDLHYSTCQTILSLINGRSHQTLPAGTHESCTEPNTNMPLTIHQTMNKSQATMPPEQIQEVRGLAYQLWLQADRPVGKEIDFWLSAEQQVIQAAAEKMAHEATLKAAPAEKSAVKKTKSTTKRTQ